LTGVRRVTLKIPAQAATVQCLGEVILRTRKVINSDSGQPCLNKPFCGVDDRSLGPAEPCLVCRFRADGDAVVVFGLAASKP
jgi:hypothetical protein